jgi:hypothetical protein
MKRLLARWLIAISLCLSANYVSANDFKSKVIQAAGHFDISIPEGMFLRIRNFTQDGGTDRGVVTVTIGEQTATVLSAARIDSEAANLEVVNSVTIGGPAEVTISAPSDARAFITYRKDKDPD